VLAFAGSYLLFRAFVLEFPTAESRPFVAAALFFMPSFAYWSSSVGKESWIALTMGTLVWGFTNAMHQFRVRYLAVMAMGFVGTALIRPPVAAVLLLGILVGMVVRRPTRRATAVLWPVMLMSIAVIGAAAFGRLASFALLEKTSAQNAAKGMMWVLYQQHVGLATDTVAGGSSLGVQIADPSIPGILSYVPWGVFTFLFRPMIFEAHNAVALVAAVETTFLLVLVVWRLGRLLSAIPLVLTRPFVTVCFVAFAGLTFILCFEANFGAIVRHRSMPLPFLLILLGMPRRRRDRRVHSAAETVRV
jgi:hypothetical protein